MSADAPSPDGLDAAAAAVPELDTARRAALAGAEVLLSRWNDLAAGEVDQKQANDYVTAADLAAERAVLEVIEAAHPGDRVLAEESADDADAARDAGGRRWLVDPLDGTLNYLRGLPVYGVSVAFEHDGVLRAGVVTEPAFAATWWAAAGHGAWRDSERLHVSTRDAIPGSVLGTGFPFREGQHLDRYMPGLREVMRVAAGIRRCGSAALDLCWTAAGRFDGFWETGLHPWDMAAGALLVREAGGVVTDFEGGDGWLADGGIVAGNPAIHDALRRAVAPRDP